MAFLTSLPPPASSPMGEKWIGGGGETAAEWMAGGGARECVCTVVSVVRKKIETGMRDLDTLDTKGTRLITRAGQLVRHYWSKSLVTKFVHSACAFNSLVN